jgi:hypothetical protein
MSVRVQGEAESFDMNGQLPTGSIKSLLHSLAIGNLHVMHSSRGM